MSTLIRAARKYANLAEVMKYANDLAVLEGALDPIHEGLVGLPHTADEIAGAWKSWVTEDLMQFVLNGRVHTIEAGFITDFASIPKVFRWFIDPMGAPHQVAAVAHDYLYSSVPVTRKDADDLYKRICEELRVSPFKTKAMHIALRVGGWNAWRNNRANFTNLGSSWRFIQGRLFT